MMASQDIDSKTMDRLMSEAVDKMMRRRPTREMSMGRPQMMSGQCNIGASTNAMMRRGLNNFSDAQEAKTQWYTG